MKIMEVYFNFEIIFDTIEYTKSPFTHNYKFSKTKNNKYLFESCFHDILFVDWKQKSNDISYSFILKGCRICNDINYNPYFNPISSSKYMLVSFY